MIRNWLRRRALMVASLALVAFGPIGAQAGDGTPVKGPLATKWAADIKPDAPLPEYPRPQLVRTDWANLNGVWQFAFGKEGEPAPVGKNLDDKILVPYPVESALSGVMKPVENGRVWYRRTFHVPTVWRDRRLILHFGAVDWEATVWVNGVELGTHKGGYDAFDYDITDALKPDGQGDQEVIVRVFDPTDGGTQPRGKQVKKPGGIFYTPTTGIWQTVWIEPVAKAAHIAGLKVVPDIDGLRLMVTANVVGDDLAGMEVAVKAFDGPLGVSASAGAKPDQMMAMKIGTPKLWSPENPFLYGLKVELRRKGETVDQVSSYAGMRKIDIAKDDKGVNRIRLNNQAIFQVGPLDQGFWPDGLYTAPTDEALRYDVEITKKLGFNMTRKHVKVEPDRWYYWCDRLGLLVWQDMPSGDKSISPEDPDITRSPESARQYDLELKEMIDGLQGHPSIVTWVVFNEGWGQFDTKRVADWTKGYDPTRLVDAASGWADRAGVGDLHDYHHYPRPAAPPLEAKRAGVLGEFGGLSLGVDGHTWQKEIWGYAGTASSSELTRKYEQLLKEGYAMKDAQGLNALVYTQITDVETEANGLLTYDRGILKVELDRATLANRGDFSNVPEIRPVVPTSQTSGLSWRYSTEKPSTGWEAPDFDASRWKEGVGVLGTKGTPGAEIRTTWNTPDVWARRMFDLPEVNPSKLLITTIHDEDAEFYLNGVLAAKVTGHTGGYEEVAINPEAASTLKPGKNVLAIHCHQTAGGQSIDAGLVEIREPKAK